jgi:hypothetical protein
MWNGNRNKSSLYLKPAYSDSNPAQHSPAGVRDWIANDLASLRLEAANSDRIALPLQNRSDGR